MQDITRKAVRPSDSEKHVKFRSIQADQYRYKIFVFDKFEKAKIQTESYLPNVELESDKKWEFETWEKECLETFMRDDFNIDGVT